MRNNYSLYTLVISAVTVLATPQIAIGISSAELAGIARNITVLINGKDDMGSGVLIKKEDKTYTVLTAHHVVEKKANM